MHAHTTGGTVDQIGSPPRLAWDGSRWWDLRTLDPDALAACSWWPVTEAPRPADTPTTTWDAAYTLTGATVERSWIERDKTPEELAVEAATAQREANRAAVRAIVDDLRAEKARCDVVLAKTNAQITGGDTKDIARAAKRIAAAAIDLARFVRDSGA